MCAVPPAKKVRKAKKQERFANLFRTDDGWMLRIIEGTETDFYAVSVSLLHDGLLFDVEKMFSTREGERGEEKKYSVGINPADSTTLCHCKGMKRWGKCRHCESLVALYGAGRLQRMIEESAGR